MIEWDKVILRGTLLGLVWAILAVWVWG